MKEIITVRPAIAAPVNNIVKLDNPHRDRVNGWYASVDGVVYPHVTITAQNLPAWMVRDMFVEEHLPVVYRKRTVTVEYIKF